MISTNKGETVSIVLDGEEVEVPAGINLVDAASLYKKEIPHYCYHPQLSVAGNCRMCLIEMGTPMRDRATGDPVLNDDGTQKIGWIPKPVIGCATTVSPGMHVKTISEKVTDCREGIMEFLLVNHPLDCPICDQAGECRLQEFATDYGRGYSRYVERKNVKPKRTRLGPRVTLDDERCILCSRCIRFSQEVAKDDVLGFVDRGSYSTLSCFPGRELENNYSLNTVDICPVGALTSTDFRFKMRVWFLKESPSICTESSAGCNIMVSSREGEIYRITPRRNDDVNDSWMTDSGRLLYKEVLSDKRLLKPLVKQAESSLDIALSSAFETFEGKKIAVVGSCKSTLEELYILNHLSKATKAKKYLRGHFGDDDGILLSADRTPNLRGALLSGFTSKYPEGDLSKLNEDLKKGVIDSVLVLNEDLLASGVEGESLLGIPVVYFGTHHNSTSNLAEVVIPTLTSFEKRGTFVNRSFIAQGFAPSVPSPAGLFPETQSLCRLLSLADKDSKITPEFTLIWKNLSSPPKSPFKGMTFTDALRGSLQVDGSKWNDFPFVEKKALHFEPQTPELSNQ
jgi:NADH-quinone oxidoreductase subunit G